MDDEPNPSEDVEDDDDEERRLVRRRDESELPGDNPPDEPIHES